jgi:glutamate N-acetyltransferase / amino-acid N-acetyltransferase
VTTSIDLVPGFKVAGVHAGLKKDGALDMALIVSDSPCVAAGVFTTNLMKAAPVLFDMEQLQHNNAHIRAVVINTKCANACTGEQGLANAREMARLTAAKVGCGEDEVLVMSTGVIGTQLPMDKIAHGIELASQSLGTDWQAAAQGIMTTDTRPKLASIAPVRTAAGQTYHITGIAKGAGMIAPNMATMLSVIVTDALISQPALESALKQAVAKTFNRIVIDGDMSTNDTVLLLAHGGSGALINEVEDVTDFVDMLETVCRQLAQGIVRDGEGVTKFITLTVTGASSDEAAHQIANAIATSPLVKTAFFGNDANWGRIVAAAGRAGVPFEPEQTRLLLMLGEHLDPTPDSLLLFEGGMPTPYDEARATALISHPEVSIYLEVGHGTGSATVWTCDLSHDYVSINGDYRS